MAGAQYAEGAIIGGILVTLFPELLRRLNLPQDLGNVLFAVGAVQALSTGETISESLRRRVGASLASPGGRDRRAQSRRSATAPTTMAKRRR